MGSLGPFRKVRQVPKTVEVPVLAYHRLTPRLASPSVESRDPYLLAESSFREQIQYLHTKGYHSLSLTDFVAHVTGQAVLPRKPVIITFDDGYESEYSLAYPILRNYGFTATFFVVVGWIGRLGMLSWDQIEEMSRNGMAIDSHTLSHPYLTELSREQIKVELSESKAILEGKMGKPVAFLGIPGGMYNNLVKEVAQETGYMAVVTSSLGTNNCRSDLYSLNRIAIKSGTTLSQFARYLEGQGMFWAKSMQFLTNILKAILGIENYGSIRRKLLRLK